MDMKMMFNKKVLAAMITAALVASPAMAKVDPSEVAKLGTELTPVGAEKAGNAAGTIPAWDGGMKTAPACYKGGEFLCNPYADDKPQFVITAQNFEQYKANLTPGQIAMMQKYPQTYKIGRASCRERV